MEVLINHVLKFPLIMEVLKLLLLQSFPELRCDKLVYMKIIFKVLYNLERLVRYMPYSIGFNCFKKHEPCFLLTFQCEKSNIMS